MKVVVMIFALQILTCLGEQAFLSQPDENPTELLEASSSIQTSQDSTKYVTVATGISGDYLSYQYATKDHAACGVRLRVEPSQDSYFIWKTKDLDDTSTNAIEITTCNWFDWNTQSYIDLNQGLWGDWGEKIMCDKDQYMYGAVAEVLGNQGSKDDTAFNGIRILCTDREGKNPDDGNYLKKLKGMEGEFQGINPEFETLRTQGYKVVGGRVRFEKYQGEDDDTALNGLDLALKKFPLLSLKRDERTTTIIEGWDGEWKGKLYSENNELACGMRRTYYDENELRDIQLLYCNIYNEDTRPDGDRVCSKGKYISGVRVNYRVSDYDKTSLAYLADVIFSCTDKYGGNKEWLKADERWWEERYKSTDEVSFKNKFVCGKQMKEEHLGLSFYATGIALSFCELKFQFK